MGKVPSCSTWVDRGLSKKCLKSLKKLLQRNALAYSSPKSATEKSVVMSSPGVNVIKLFSSMLMTRPNKLECLHLAKTFQSGLTFARSTRGLPKKEAYEMCSNWVGSGLALKF